MKTSHSLFAASTALVLALAAPAFADTPTPAIVALAGADLTDSGTAAHPTTRAAHFHADAEVDPTGYLSAGYSLHMGVGYRRVRVDLGTYAMRMPAFAVGNDDYTLSMDGFGLKAQYFLTGEQRGGFVGVDTAIAHAFAHLKGTDMARRELLVGVGVDAGWRFTLPAGFYVTPWLGLGYEINARDVTLAGKTLHISHLLVFPAVHLGYRFR